MFTMIVVNDFAGMEGLPHWMHHAATQEDMLGFSDLVFPAFLFCVGLSIPFAIGARYNRGDNALGILGHIVWRSLALVVMGLFSMNMRGVEGGLSGPVFTLLAIAGFFLVWNERCPIRSGMTQKKASGMTQKETSDITRQDMTGMTKEDMSTMSRDANERHDSGHDNTIRHARLDRASILRTIGILLLAGLVVYKDLHGMPFRHGWWGILGLIGWAYLPCALAYVALRGDFRKMWGFWLLTELLCMLNAVESIPADWSSRALILGFWPGGWTHPLICATGMMTSLHLIQCESQPRKWLKSCLALVGSMLVLGLVCHRVWIISKNLATPTWAFFCLAISIALFGLLHWVADIKGHTRWARPISPAATATLTCYMMPSIWYAVQQLLGLHWPPVLYYGLPGLAKALVFSFIIIGLTALFNKLHLKLKL